MCRSNLWEIKVMKNEWRMRVFFCCFEWFTSPKIWGYVESYTLLVCCAGRCKSAWWEPWEASDLQRFSDIFAKQEELFSYKDEIYRNITQDFDTFFRIEKNLRFKKDTTIASVTCQFFEEVCTYEIITKLETVRFLLAHSELLRRNPINWQLLRKRANLKSCPWLDFIHRINSGIRILFVLCFSQLQQVDGFSIEIAEIQILFVLFLAVRWMDFQSEPPKTVSATAVRRHVRNGQSTSSSATGWTLSPGLPFDKRASSWHRRKLLAQPLVHPKNMKY